MRATLFGLCGAALVGIGLVRPHRSSASCCAKILAFNLLGGGVFLLFGVVARRGAAAGFDGDPVPQALVITGLVVAFSATALGRCADAPALPGIGPGIARLRALDRGAGRGSRPLMLDAASLAGATQMRDVSSPGAGDRPAGRRRVCFRWCSADATRSASLSFSSRPVSASPLAILAGVARSGEALTYVLGGWAPPLGVTLRADGFRPRCWSPRRS